MIKLKDKSKKQKAAPYVRRTLEDKRVHRHVADAAASVHKAYLRASRRGGAEALEDKKLYDHVRGAAGSLRAALGIVSRAGAQAQGPQAADRDRDGPRRRRWPRRQEEAELVGRGGARLLVGPGRRAGRAGAARRRRRSPPAALLGRTPSADAGAPPRLRERPPVAAL